ncbi:MAG: family 20 glycosylhydrolase [Ignavibacteriaceae bacterium]
MKNIFVSFLLLFSILTNIELSAQKSVEKIDIIPYPASLIQHEGYFTINESTKIVFDESTEIVVNYLLDILQPSTGYKFNLEQLNDEHDDNSIVLKLSNSNPELGSEGYVFKSTEKKLVIEANELNGLFYGIQTLRQLLPVGIESKSKVQSIDWKIPCVEIKDKPQFVWRGLNLDCCRHFMSKDFVKRYIDLLAYHKMNILHWHLTEDQAWRIEIKKYPELTNKGAWRKYDNDSVYGGYYSQEDIKEVVKYAASRFVTVVPEIEMPGHSTAAISCYPEISCTGGPFNVGTLWGIYYDIYCAGNEKTFHFLEDVIGEVVELFPGKYIHIGGDEVPKERWENCPKCQARIKSENLKDEHELQSYFVKRMEKFINSKGKQIIGWDEILEGGLAPEATVQSWRGLKGAIDAAKQGHDVIVSPTTNCYFDYPVDVTDLQKVYLFDPVPQELTVEERKHVLGSEGNMWSEYAPQEQIADRLFPRLLALSEVVWTYPAERNYEEFRKRVQKHYDKLEMLGVSYGLETKPFEIKKEFDPTKDVFNVQIKQLQKDIDLNLVSYKIDHKILSADSGNNIVVNHSDNIKLYFTRGNKNVGKIFESGFTFNKATGKTVKLTYPFNEKYPASGVNALTDGLRGSDNFRGGNKSWQGFQGTNFEAVIDLDELTDFNKISIGFFQASSSWVVFPEYVEFYTSDDGVNYSLVNKIINTPTLKNPDWVQKDFFATSDNLKARYIKIYAKNLDSLPSWHPAYGGSPWLMADEIIVE